MPDDPRLRAVVLVSANAEWGAVCRQFSQLQKKVSPLGEWFQIELQVDGKGEPVIFFHGGWGKIAAAASSQYVIDRWKPDLLVNLGTCGGFAGEVAPGEILLAERTLIYDIIEQIGDQAAALAHYTTDLDLTWLAEPLPMPVRRVCLVSADRDLLATEIPRLHKDFGAIAGDWESGAIGYVAARNGSRCLILRGVSDLVGQEGGEAYGDRELWVTRTEMIMKELIEALPAWLAITNFTDFP